MVAPMYLQRNKLRFEKLKNCFQKQYQTVTMTMFVVIYQKVVTINSATLKCYCLTAIIGEITLHMPESTVGTEPIQIWKSSLIYDEAVLDAEGRCRQVS